MNSVFENIIEKLEEMIHPKQLYFCKYARGGCKHLDNDDKDCMECVVENAIEIVKQEADQYNNGWIPCSNRLPEECVPVNVTWINRNPESYYAKIKDVPFSATAVYYNSKWYWYSSTCVDYLSEYGKNDFDLVDKDIDIIAWMELPSAYRPKEK